MATTTRTAYRVTAFRPIGNGQIEDLNEAATLGNEIDRTHATRAEAETVAAELQRTVSDVGLDPRTVYEVEEVEVDACPVCGGAMPRQQQSRRVAHNGLVVCDRATCETRADEYRFRIVGGNLPIEVDSDGYDTRTAAEGMASEYAEGEYRIEAYR